MKKRILLLLLICCALFVAGCSKSDSVSANCDAEEENFDTEEEVFEGDNEVPEAIEEAEEESEVREVVDGKIRSYFTGEWIDEELGTSRPLAMMMNCAQDALPMSAPTSASVIYECPVEGRTTRWMGIFEDWRELERIGSVRSCRLYFLHFAQEFDAVYGHFGQAFYALDDLNSGKFDVLSGGTKGIDSPVTAMYDRISRPGKVREHTLYAFPSGIEKDIENKGYDMTMPEDYEGKFKFAKTGEIAEYEGYPEATLLQPGGTGGKNGFGGVKATFEYNASDRKYYRSTYGNPHVDELTGEQVAVTNVIFQYCNGEVLDSKDYLHFATQEQRNKCIVFTNGKMIEGYWRNPGELGTPARYYEEDDTEIVLNVGKTFICTVWTDYEDDVVIQ